MALTHTDAGRWRVPGQVVADDVGRRPTLDMVAAAANVGRGTASRALSGSPQVSERARRAVLHAAEELGYRPNRAARSLVTRRSDSIALVVSEAEDRLFGDPFFARIVRGAHAELAATDLQLVFTITQSAAARARLEAYSEGRHVDGVLLISLHDEDPLPRVLERAGTPVVICGRPLRDPQRYYVDANNRGGARAAVDHLLRTGRRTVATIAGPQDMSPGMDRLLGYEEALHGAGQRVERQRIAVSDFTEEGARDAMAELLRRVPGIDAVFVASDLMAAGALHTLKKAGRRVPDEVAVIGFDDLPLARLTDPPLSTVSQPVDEMGRRMTRMLLARIQGEPVDQRHVVLPTSLVLRDTA